jgi:hypothetical protein
VEVSPVPAELSGSLGLSDVLARLPYLTFHLVELPDRWWVADPASLNVWVHKSGSEADRAAWASEAASAVLAAQDGAAGQAPMPGRAPRLHSVPRR